MAKALNVSLQVSADTGQAKQALQQLQQQLTQLTTTSTNITIGGDIKQGALEASKAIAQLQTSLKNSTNSLTGNLNLTKFNQEMVQSGMSLQKYQTQLQAMGPAGQKAFAQLASSIAQAEVPLRRTSGLFSELWTTMKNTARWQISSSILHSFMGAIQGAYQYAQDLNKSLTDIQIVTQASDEHMAQFAKTANTAAKQLSTTTNSYTKASLIYYQQGLGDKEVKERTDATVKMANVTGQTAQQVSDQMTAIWNNFDDGAHSLEYYADVITALGAATASSSAEISTGLQKFAAVADTVGLSYENATAALATITATTRQSADTVGTGLRTVFSRLQSLNLGETLDDGVTLTKYSKAMQKIGVDVLDATGNLRAMNDILMDMGEKWQDLTDAQKTATAQTIGGVRQYTTIMALMENFDFYKENLDVAKNSEGTLQKQQEIYEKSWQAASKRVRASAESVYSDLLNDKFFIKLTNGFEKFLDLIHNTISGLGGLKGVLLAIGTLMTTVFADKTVQRLQNIVYDLKMLTPKGRAEVQGLQQQGAQMLVNSVYSGKDQYSQAMSTAYSQQGALQAAYLANAEKMGAAQQQVAQSLMQQQAALIQNVELQAQAVEKAQQEADLQERTSKMALRDLYNTSTLGKTEKTDIYGDLKFRIDKAANLSTYQGQADSFINGLNALKNAEQGFNLDNIKQQLQNFPNLFEGFSTTSFEAGNKFKKFVEAVNSNDLTAVKTAFDNLWDAFKAPMGNNALDNLRSTIHRLAQDLGGEDTEAVKKFEQELEKLFSEKYKSGQLDFGLHQQTEGLKTYTQQLKQAMDELANKPFTALDGFVAMAGALSSIGMMISQINGLIDVWNNKDLSFGKKITSTLIQVGMLASAMGRIFSAESIAKMTKFNEIIFKGTGTAGSLKNTGAQTAEAVTAKADAQALREKAAAANAAGAGSNVAAEGATVDTAATLGEAAANEVAAKTFEELAASIWAAYWPLLAIAAIAGGIYLIAKAIETPAEKLERLQNNLNEISDWSQEASNAVSDLLEQKETHNNLLETLDSLKEGTIEFYDALLEANSAAEKLISTYNLVYGIDYNFNGKGGAINFTDQGYTTMEQGAKELAYQGIIQQSLAKLRVTKADTDIFNKKYNSNQADMPSYSWYFDSAKKGNLARGPIYDEIDSIVQQYMGMSLQNYIASGGSWSNVIAQANKTHNAEYTPLLANSLLAYGNTYGEETFSKLSNLEQQAMVDAFTSQHGAETYYDLIDQKEAELEKVSGTRLRDLYKATVNSIVPDVDEATLKAEIAQAQVMSELGSQFMSQTMDNIGDYANYQEMTINELDEALLNLSQYGEGTVGKAAHDIIQTYRDNLEKSFNQKVSDLGLTGITLNSAQKAGMSGVDINNWTGLIDSIKGAFTNTDFAERFSKEIGLSIFDGQNFNAGLLGALKQIDWSSNLTSVIGLGQMAKFAKLQGATYADQITKYYEESLGSIKDTELLEDLEKNGDFQDALKSLQKQFKKTGKIGAQEIEDTAESCDILNEALEYGGLSAGALGDALSLMSMGAVEGLGDISEALWAALEAANAFEDSLANAFEYIDNFGNTLSRSTQDLSDFFSKYSKDMFALLGEGNVGGERLYQEASAIWGQKYSDSLRSFFISQETGTNKDNPYARQKAYSEKYGDFDAVMQQVQKSGNLQAYWNFMLDSKNSQKIQDIMGIENASQALNNIGITQGKNKDIEVNVGGRTTDQMRQQLKDTLGLTDEQANLYLQELAGHGAFLTQDLKTNDFMAGYNSFLDENGNIKSNMAADARAFLQSQGPQNFDLMRESLERQAQAQKTQIDKLQAKETAGTLSDDEAKTLANLRDAAEETAKMQENLDNAKQSMEDLANDTKLFEETSKEGVLDWENVSKTTKDALKNIAEQSKVTIKREVQSPYGGGAKYTTTTDSYDVDTIMDKAQKMGMSQEQAFEAVKKTAQSAGAEISRSWTDMYGNIHTYSQKAEGSIDEFDEKYQETFAADKHRENAEFGKDLFKGFIEAAEEAQLTADGLDLDLDAVINVTSEGLDVVKSDLEAVEGDHPATIAVSEDGVAKKTKDELDSIPGTYTGTVAIGGNYGVASTTASALASIPGTYDATVNITVNEQGGASGGIVSGGMSGYISRLSERIKAKHSHALGGLVGSHAIGSANRQLKPGLSLTAEEGPEIIWNKQEGYSYVVGGNGHPEFVVLRPGDRVFNANQTREILNHDKPDSNYFSSILDPKNLDQRLFGSFAAGNGSVYGSYGPNSRYGGASGAANQKEKDYTPERYHVITRQIQDLTFWYEELKKARENAYGTNILDHIDEELKGTEELIKAQEALVKEAEHYREIDLQKMKDLGINFELDENGNIRNWEELQEKYRKAAEQNKDDTEAKERWNAIQQYEETLDKWQEAYADFTDLRLQAAELLLDKITTKTELKIDFDERDLKLIEHFTKKIDDNIYDTAKVLQLAGLSLDKINDKIDTTRQGITEIFENMTDSKGNQIADMTLEKFLSLSEAERDALDINHDFGKQLEEYSDDLLNYIEDLEDLKTKGIDELNQAFDELNDNIQSSMDLFNYYQDTLDNLKNIIDLQGVTISKDLRDVFQTINQTLLSNNANNIQAELVRYEKLRDVVTDLQNKLSAVTDPTLQKEWENQLKEAEEALRDSQTNLLTLWQNGLDMAKQVFEQNIDNAVREFEEQVAGAYGDLNGLQAAYDRRKEIDNFYVDDYEKYYQISKLQRQINKDLNDAAKNHNKNVKGLNILFDDLNDAREAGVELTAYDLDIFAKRYAYEKALMDLEDSRNAKQQVRLQRDANGNWGYIYTAAEDDDDLIRKQQAVEDALYEWQKATTTEANKYSDEILPKIRANLEAIAEAYKTGSDIPQNILNDTKELLSLWGPQFQKTLEDGAQTLDIAIDRYNNASFDIFDNLNESGLAAVLETGEGIDQLLDILISQMDTANDEMNTASMNYKNQIDNLNNFFKEYGDSLGTVINAWAQAVGEDSEENKANTSQMIENAKLTFDEILSAANEFEDKFMEKYEPIISRNEQFIIALNEALDALNRKEFVQGQLLPYIGSYIDPSSFASGGFTGAWGSGGRLAVLHEKENVFNAEDTSRLLSASQILRTIDLSISSFAAGFGNILLPNPGPIGNSLDQNVHIEASFPSVTDHNEIELAFDNLINKASQYANRKNMSSMTFQDMYTSKF